MNTTPTHLRRIFNKVRGHPAHTVFRREQIKRATELLATTQMTQEEIAGRCGFGSVSDFSRVFSRKLGCPAHKWRNQLDQQEPVGYER